MFSSLFGWRIRSETTAQLMRICCFTDDWARRVRLLCSSAHPCFASTWHDFKKEECLASLASLTQGAQRGSTAARNAGLLYTSESPEQSTDEDHQEDDIEWYPYDYDDYWWDDGDVDTGGGFGVILISIMLLLCCCFGPCSGRGTHHRRRRHHMHGGQHHQGNHFGGQGFGGQGFGGPVSYTHLTLPTTPYV